MKKNSSPSSSASRVSFFQVLKLISVLICVGIVFTFFAAPGSTRSRESQMPPWVANPDSYTGVRGANAANGVKKNDDNAGGTTAHMHTPPANASNYGLNFDGSFFYIPALNFIGTDTFEYKLCGPAYPNDCSAPATVTVAETNTKPFPNADVYLGWAAGYATDKPKMGLLGNDFDKEGDYLEINTSYHLQNPAAAPQHGGVGFSLNGTFYYQVTTPGFTGLDKFDYQVCDYTNATKLSCSTMTAFIVVGAVDDPSANLGETCPGGSVGEPVNVTNGNMWLKQTDYRLPGSGQQINLTRTYNSSRQPLANNPFSYPVGIFGLGWSTEYEQFISILDNRLIRLYMGDGRSIFFTRPDTTSVFKPSDSPDYHATFTKNPDATYTLKHKDGRSWNFNTNGRLVALKDRNNNQATLNYDVFGRLTGITDTFNRTLTITFNTDGYVGQISDSTGVVATYEYYPISSSSPALLKTVTYFDGSQYKFEYTTVNGKSYLQTVKDALDNVLETHLYDAQGRAYTSQKHGDVEKYTLDFSAWGASEPYTKVTSVRVAGGPQTETKYYFDRTARRDLVKKVEGVCACGGTGNEASEFTYDAKWNLIKTKNALGQETNFTHDDYGNPLTVTDIWGTQKYTYNQFGQILTYRDRIDSDLGNNTVVNVYDANGNLQTTTDALGKTTTFTYTTIGQLKTVTDARSNTTTLNWKAVNGHLESVKYPNNKLTSYVFDDRGRLKSVTDPLAQTTQIDYLDTQQKRTITYHNTDVLTYEYDLAGRLKKVIDPKGYVTQYDFDGAGRLKKITDPLLHVTEYDYDLMSNLTLVKDAEENITDFVYDEFSRLKEIVHPIPSTGEARVKELFKYDKLGRTIEYTITPSRITTYSYDDVNRINKTTNSENEITEYRYNKRLQTTKVIDDNQQEYDFTYDALNRLLTQARAGGTMTFEYDEVGNIKKRTDYSGRVTAYKHDNLNRLEEVEYSIPTQFTASPMPNLKSKFTYDDASRLYTAENEAGTITFDYDRRDRLTKETDVFGHVIEYKYDKNSNREWMKIDGALHATYTFDDANRLKKIISADDSSEILFDYDDENKLISRGFPNGVTTTYDYDGMDRIKRVKDSTSSATLFDRQYNYNTTSQLNQIIEPTNTRTLIYDSVDRLKTVTASNNQNESYNYDDVGNRTSSHLSASYNYQPFNKLTSTTSASYAYDANGNTVSKAEGSDFWQYVYDHENRLTSASTRKQSVRYVYDALGRRVRRHLRGAKELTKYVYDGADVVMDDDANSGVTKYQNGLGVDEKLRMKNGSAANYFLADHLGSTNALTNASGNITSSAAYDSYGNSTNTLATRFQYAGREYDGFANLYYNRARFYDPKSGRFTSEDPIGLAGGINLYEYGASNPLERTDPFGMSPSDTLARVNEAINRAGQATINRLEKPTEFALGFGDNSGMVTRQIRQYQGIDPPGLDCSGWYAAGEYTSMVVEVFIGGVGIYKAIGKLAAKRALKRAAKECLLCFEAGTQVQTEEGLKPIEKIEAGDKVLSYDEDTGFLEYQEVLQKISRYAEDIFSVRVEGETQPLGVTSEHPFYVRIHRARDNTSGENDDGEWRETRNLQSGDEIKLANGTWAKILEIRFKGAGQVYNFTVAKNHNYFVGDLRLLTHNSECEEILYRYGTDRESAKRLARKAQEAEDAGYPHGVSVTGTVPEFPSSSASRSLIEKMFKVHNTPTRRDPLHKTLELPKPVTQEVADLFNKIFGR